MDRQLSRSPKADSRRSTARNKKFWWSPESTLRLIEELESQCGALWDTKHNSYKERLTRQKKIEYLADTFDTTQEEISRKIHNLRSQFGAEVRKIRKRKREYGDEESVVSTWEYFEPLSFLLTPGSLDVPTIVTTRASTESVDIAFAEFPTTFNSAESVTGDSAPSPRASAAGGSDRSASPQDVKHPVWVAAKTRERKRDTRVSRERDVLAAVTSRAPASSQRDECQVFGDFVASELRQLRSEENRKRLKRIIQKAIIKIGDEDSGDCV